MSGGVGDGQKSEEVAWEPDDGVDDAPDSGNLSKRCMNCRTAAIQRFTFFCETVCAQVVHLLQAAGCRIVGRHCVRYHLRLRSKVKAKLEQHDHNMIVKKKYFHKFFKSNTVYDQNKSNRNNYASRTIDK